MKPILFLLALPLSYAHMELMLPFPLGSRYDPQNTDAMRDYNMMAPLLPDGSNYPCLGHHLAGGRHTTATFKAGSEYSIKVTGSASHLGGSCQLSLSYDNGATFRVIKSIIGGCPLKLEYTFTVPESAPSAPDALFAWTWFSKEGALGEMYMNCARVAVTGGAAAADAFKKLPLIYRANIFGDECVVPRPGAAVPPEQDDVVFTHPGEQVEWGIEGMKGQRPTKLLNCPVDPNA